MTRATAGAVTGDGGLVQDGVTGAGGGRTRCVWGRL